MQQVIQHIRHSLCPLYSSSEANALVRLLLEKRYGISMLDVCMGKDRHFSPEQARDLEDILSRLRRYEPVQYVLGEADFCGLSFEVNRHVLIPRPETAELVSWIEDDYPAAPRSILDIGTGSGCISVALAKRYPEADVHAWDISPEALDVACRNSRRNGTSVRFEQRDLFARNGTAERFEVIVSNPPYVTASEKKEMEPNVLEWEPAAALFVPDEDPLRFYRRIAALGQELLLPSGTLYLEINRAYGSGVKAMLEKRHYRQVEIRKDLSGNDRMVKASL